MIIRALIVGLGLVISVFAPLRAAPALEAAADGQAVFDSRLGVTWLANANLAATQTFGVSNINASGSMTYPVALRWVRAMNAHDHGNGYLGHNNWQLPATPDRDDTCDARGRQGESFGYHCSASALGSLYYNALGLRAPHSAVPIPSNSAGAFRDFQPYLYWSASQARDSRQGFVSFSFNTGFQGANVARNYLYVLPVIERRAEVAGTIYDPGANLTWLADANLAAKQTFGVSGIDPDGSMDHTTALRWIAALNDADSGRGYLGQKDWQLPNTGSSDPSCSLKGTTGYNCTRSALASLYSGLLGLRAGEPVVKVPDIHVGSFHNIQPYLYWACAARASALCSPEGPADGFAWNFSFGNGFQGTNLVSNALYTMVYYPGH